MVSDLQVIQRLKRLSLTFVIFGLVALGLMLMCMFTYARPYHWEYDFLSAMGLTRLPADEGGATNYFTSAVFNLILIACGIMSTTYFVVRGKMSHGWWRKLPIIGFGIIGGIGLIGIGCVPFNWNGNLHNLCTLIAIAGYAPAILFVSTEGRNWFGSPFENLCGLGFLFYIWLIWNGLNWCAIRGELPGNAIHPILQKLMISAFWCYMMQANLRLYLKTRAELRKIPVSGKAV